MVNPQLKLDLQILKDMREYIGPLYTPNISFYLKMLYLFLGLLLCNPFCITKLSKKIITPIFGNASVNEEFVYMKAIK